MSRVRSGVATALRFPQSLRPPAPIGVTAKLALNFCILSYALLTLQRSPRFTLLNVIGVKSLHFAIDAPVLTSPLPAIAAITRTNRHHREERTASLYAPDGARLVSGASHCLIASQPDSGKMKPAVRTRVDVVD